MRQHIKNNLTNIRHNFGHPPTITVNNFSAPTPFPLLGSNFGPLTLNSLLILICRELMVERNKKSPSKLFENVPEKSWKLDRGLT